MFLEQFSPYIRVAMDSKINFPWHLKERVLFDYELLYVKEGRIKVTIEDQSYIGEPGDLFLFHPKQRHSLKKIGTGPLRQPHLHFDLHYKEDSPDVKISFKTLKEISSEEMRWFREDRLDQFSIHLASHLRLRNPIIIEKMIFDIINEFQMKLPYYETNVKGMFIQLFIHLLLRIEKAKEMVQFTLEPLNVIAEKFGYPDIHTFSKAFKKMDGASPSFYRKHEMK